MLFWADKLVGYCKNDICVTWKRCHIADKQATKLIAGNPATDLYQSVISVPCFEIPGITCTVPKSPKVSAPKEYSRGFGSRLFNNHSTLFYRQKNDLPAFQYALNFVLPKNIWIVACLYRFNIYYQQGNYWNILFPALNTHSTSAYRGIFELWFTCINSIWNTSIRKYGNIFFVCCTSTR